jgi:hypothetical protein
LYPIVKSRLQNPQRLSAGVVEGIMNFVLRMHRMYFFVKEKRASQHGPFYNVERSFSLGVMRRWRQLVVEGKKLTLLALEIAVICIEDKGDG